VEGGRRTFSSPTHRKIRLYRAYADFSDSNGHGTHTSGTLAGIPLTMGLGAAGGANVGMAPDAKLAFIGAPRRCAGRGGAWELVNEMRLNSRP
jgi:subtilisin family serine protease